MKDRALQRICVFLMFEVSQYTKYIYAPRSGHSHMLRANLALSRKRVTSHYYTFSIHIFIKKKQKMVCAWNESIGRLQRK